MVEDSACTIAACCRTARQRFTEVSFQRTLWKREGILWDCDAPPDIITAGSQILQWRLASPLSGIFQITEFGGRCEPVLFITSADDLLGGVVNGSYGLAGNHHGHCVYQKIYGPRLLLYFYGQSNSVESGWWMSSNINSDDILLFRPSGSRNSRPPENQWIFPAAERSDLVLAITFVEMSTVTRRFARSAEFLSLDFSGMLCCTSCKSTLLVAGSANSLDCCHNCDLVMQ